MSWCRRGRKNSADRDSPGAGKNVGMRIETPCNSSLGELASVYRHGINRLGRREVKMPRNAGAYIENEAAYAEATERRIKENARRGRMRRWLDDPAVTDRQRLLERMEENQWHSFLNKMFQSYLEWGSLTEGQERAVRDALAKLDVRKAEKAAGREAERQVDRGSSKHIGEVGKRQDFALTIQRIPEYEGQFGLTYIHLMKDAGGNVVVYKGGTRLGEPGEAVMVKATVKEHGERDGVAQTVISRPKALQAVT